MMTIYNNFFFFFFVKETLEHKITDDNLMKRGER